MRQPCYSVELVEAVRELRGEYPRWGKDKLAVLLYDKVYCCSVSTVGRIVRRLKERGVFVSRQQTTYQAGRGRATDPIPSGSRKSMWLRLRATSSRWIRLM